MNTTITIEYSTDDNSTDINDSVASILNNTLPYMADNVTIHFDVEEE